MSLRVGIIGCGGVAKLHIAGYQENQVEITGLVDVNQAAVKAAAKDIPGVKCFCEHEALLDSGLVDAVSICTPPVAHEDAAVSALRRNIPILCEKPLAHSVDSAKRIVAAAEESGTVLMTAFRHRFLPAIQTVRRVISQGEIGQVVLFQNVFCGPAFQMKDTWFSRKAVAGGGTLMDTSIHSVDIFRYLIGEVIEQKALTHRHLEGTDVEDASIITLKAESGAIGSLMASWVAGDGMAFIDIVGQEGRVVYDYAQADEVRLKRGGETQWKVIGVEASNGFAEEISHFLAALRQELPLSCTGEDGLRALEIIQSTYRVGRSQEI